MYSGVTQNWEPPLLTGAWEPLGLLDWTKGFSPNTKAQMSVVTFGPLRKQLLFYQWLNNKNKNIKQNKSLWTLLVKWQENLLCLKFYFTFDFFTSRMCQINFDFKLWIKKRNYLDNLKWKSVKFEHKFESVIQYLLNGLKDMALL